VCGELPCLSGPDDGVPSSIRINLGLYSARLGLAQIVVGFASA
jgi:hypothetical protein